MKKTEMLKKNYEFKKVFSKGKYFSGENVEAFIKKDDKNKNFLGIAVSVKTAKAVRRNQIKRYIRESYYFFEDKILDGYSIVFLWKKKANIKNAKFENIKADMKVIFEKANLIKM